MGKSNRRNDRNLLIIFIIFLILGCSEQRYLVVQDNDLKEVDAEFTTIEEANEYLQKYSQSHKYKIVEK